MSFRYFLSIAQFIMFILHKTFLYYNNLSNFFYFYWEKRKKSIKILLHARVLFRYVLFFIFEGSAASLKFFDFKIHMLNLAVLPIWHLPLPRLC